MIRRSPGPYLIVFGIAALAVIAAGGLLSLALTESPILVVACVGGILMAATTYFSPRVAFYALIASAMFNRFDVFVAGVHLRPDHIVIVPVLIGIAPLLAMELLERLSQPSQRLRVPALSLVVFSGFVLYISTNLLSSYLFSPLFWESFQIVPGSYFPLWLSRSHISWSEGTLVWERRSSPCWYPASSRGR